MRCSALKKMAPKPGPFIQNSVFRPRPETKETIAETLDLQASKPGIGLVAIADRDPGAGHQKAVDGGHQAAQEAGGWSEAGGSSVGHDGPLFSRPQWAAVSSAADLGIPDASDNPSVCIAA
jgi:hypothetical protein